MTDHKLVVSMSDFRPANVFAQNYGVKSLVYGPPGVGKTPIFNTAPRPVLCACEPGLLSMRNSNIPTYPAFTAARIDAFFDWLFGSNEASNFDTVGIDSGSQMAEIYLAEEFPRHKDKRAAYGQMARRAYAHLERLYFLPYKHVYLICKQGNENGRNRPFMPGQDLNIRLPHLYDEILQCSLVQMPQFPLPVKAFRTRDSYDTMARDRSGNLDEFEPCDLAALFTKAMR